MWINFTVLKLLTSWQTAGNWHEARWHEQTQQTEGKNIFSKAKYPLFRKCRGAICKQVPSEKIQDRFQRHQFCHLKTDILFLKNVVYNRYLLNNIKPAWTKNIKIAYSLSLSKYPTLKVTDTQLCNCEDRYTCINLHPTHEKL